MSMAEPLSHPVVFGAILAGGEARRLGRANKALVPLAGRPMIAHVIERFRPQVAGLVINANRDLAALSEPGLAGRGTPALAVLSDNPAFAGRGPLAGLLRCLTELEGSGRRCTHLATVSTDVPFLPSDFVARLVAAVTGTRSVAIATSNGNAHPVAALWPLELAGPLHDYLRAEPDNRVRAFAAQHDPVLVDFPSMAGGFDPFFNVNTPADLITAQRMIAAMDTGAS